MGKFGGFQKVKLTKPQKSRFDLSHEKRLNVRPGDLVPVLITECVPSDKFNGSTEVLTRLAPLLAPIYEQVIVYVHFFFVPNRILWLGWEDFITGGRLGEFGPGDEPIPPYFEIPNAVGVYPGAWDKYSLADYLGCPIFADLPGVGAIGDYANCNVDAMPFLAYFRVYCDYYIDRNFSTLADDDYLPFAGGQVTGGAVTEFMSIRRRMYRKEYFTSALPFTQRGEEVLLPVELSGYAPVVGRAADGSITHWDVASNQFPGGAPVDIQMDSDPDAPAGAFDDGIFGYANLNSVTDGYAASINDFRSAYALQVWLERNAVGGSRYTESTQAHFGVRPQDSRLQRAEYIGGGRINVKISEVVSTSYSTNVDDTVVPLANLAGHGVSYGNTNGFNYFCTEHGFIMGILSIMSPPSYHQGLPKMFRRRSFLDYPWPTFAKLGEQQVDKAELLAIPANLTEDADGVLPLFGYQSRYAEWKFIPTTNHGDFHDTLLFWTATVDFAADPELGPDFLTPTWFSMNRWFAVTGLEDDECNYWLYVHNRLSVSRPLPYFGTPNTLGFA